MMAPPNLNYYYYIILLHLSLYCQSCRRKSKELFALMKKLCSVGALTMLQSGKAGKSSRRAALYRREA